MERLTYRSPVLNNATSYGACQDVKCSLDCENCKIGAIISKLCAYEDTGLTPEEIKEVQEAMAPIPFGRFHGIMEAEREERILVLPFKPGTEYFGHCHVRNANPISTGRFYPPHVPTLGVDAWLTREEAEAALKGQEG